MTISYSGNFAKLLLRWKGSIWKTVWKELLVYLLLYYIVRILYHHILGPTEQRVFTFLIREFDGYTFRIPIMFLLGFYVSTVVKRWWEQFEWLAWPDDVISTMCYMLSSDDDNTRARRQCVARYLNLTAALAWRDISVKVRKRFPTIDHIVRAGLMTPEEHQIYDKSSENCRWFLPLNWAQFKVQEYCKINSVPAPLVSQFLDYLYIYRRGFRELHCYDWVCIPLVYTQVAAIATYGYFTLCLIGRQFPINDLKIRSTSAAVDYYIPVFTILEFLCYIGWFKVGQDLMRPFEEDDDDFELNYILDRNIRVSSSLANVTAADQPSLKLQQTGWDSNDSVSVPHTKISARLQYHPPKLHAYINFKDAEDVQKADPFSDSMSDPKKKRRYF